MWWVGCALFMLVIASQMYSNYLLHLITVDVERGMPLEEAPSWRVFVPKGQAGRWALREHRQRYPSSGLRRRYYLARALAVLCFVLPWVILGIARRA